MKNLLKNELKVLAHYFGIALFSGCLVFVSQTRSMPGINLREEWLNYAPVFGHWLTIFAVLGALRLIFVLLLRKLTARS